jgi:hypothetical protein
VRCFPHKDAEQGATPWITTTTERYMMSNTIPLTFDQWKSQYHPKLTQEAIYDLKRFHGIDAEVEVEKISKQEYDLYLERFDVDRLDFEKYSL